MKIFINENGNIIENFDFSIGSIINTKTINVKNNWIKDSNEQGHWESIKFYPETGGEDVEWIVDIPENGHWESTFDDGLEHPEYILQIPNDANKSNGYEDTFEIATVHIYTDEEQKEIKRKNDKELEKQKEQKDFIENGASRLAATESLQVTLMKKILEIHTN